MQTSRVRIESGRVHMEWTTRDDMGRTDITEKVRGLPELPGMPGWRDASDYYSWGDQEARVYVRFDGAVPVQIVDGVGQDAPYPRTDGTFATPAEDAQLAEELREARSAILTQKMGGWDVQAILNAGYALRENRLPQFRRMHGGTWEFVRPGATSWVVDTTAPYGEVEVVGGWVRYQPART